MVVPYYKWREAVFCLCVQYVFRQLKRLNFNRFTLFSDHFLRVGEGTRRRVSF